jgi:ubiquinone/menaquinone biosynthesis C-methylase UbiE
MRNQVAHDQPMPSEDYVLAQKLFPLLRCPVCHGSVTPISINGDGYSCKNGHTWSVEDGVVVFTRNDPPSDNWSASQKDFAAYASSTRNWVRSSSPQVESIVEQIAAHGSGLHLDICTGQGGLLYNLIRRVSPPAGILSIDMSLHVQRFNSRYLHESDPQMDVTFISADASDLPLADSSVETVSSFHMGNMLDRMRPGMSEVARVLRPGGLFAFNHISIEDGSGGWAAFDREMRGMGKSDYRFVVLRPEFEKMMDGCGFVSYQVQVVGETVGEPGRDWEAGPTFPFPNEPMTELLVTARK